MPTYMANKRQIYGKYMAFLYTAQIWLKYGQNTFEKTFEILQTCDIKIQR